MNDVDFYKELEKNVVDKENTKKELERFKNNFAREVLEGGIGVDIRNSLKSGLVNEKKRKPLKMRALSFLSKFFNKVMFVLSDNGFE